MREVAWQCWVTFIKIGPFRVHVWIKGYSSYLRVTTSYVIEKLFSSYTCYNNNNNNNNYNNKKKKKKRKTKWIAPYFQSLSIPFPEHCMDYKPVKLLRGLYTICIAPKNLPILIWASLPSASQTSCRQVETERGCLSCFSYDQKIKVSLLYATLL